MISVTFTEFRKDASALFSAVENGGTTDISDHDQYSSSNPAYFDITTSGDDRGTENDLPDTGMGIYINLIIGMSLVIFGVILSRFKITSLHSIVYDKD